MNFEYSHILWVLPLSVFALGIGFNLGVIRNRKRVLALGDATHLFKMGSGLSHFKRTLRYALWSIAVLLCVIALSNPRTEEKSTFSQHGMDIVFVYDFSVSMLAEDVYPNRLTRSLREGESLSEALRADRIANVLFAGGAVHFPLTHDHRAAMSLYQGAGPADLRAGADIGQALKLAYCILKSREAEGLCEILQLGEGGQPLYGEIRAPALAAWPSLEDRSSVIVLFSDGEDSQGYARQEAQIARSLGIELFVVGVGSEKGALVPVLDEDGNVLEIGSSVRRELSTLNGELLRLLPGSQKNRYYGLDHDGFHRGSLLSELRGLARGDRSTRETRTRRSLYDRFLALAFVLLIFESLLSERKWRKSILA